jgi:hypothetical protein
MVPIIIGSGNFNKLSNERLPAASSVELVLTAKAPAMRTISAQGIKAGLLRIIMPTSAPANINERNGLLRELTAYSKESNIVVTGISDIKCPLCNTAGGYIP